MKKTLLFCLLSICTLLTVTPFIVHGTGHGDPSQCTGGTIDPTSGACVPSTGDSSSFVFSIPNPVRSFDNLPDLIVALLEIVRIIATPIVAVMIIYAGYLFATARGNETKITKAKETLLYVVIGAIIILGAKVIADAIQGTVNSLM